MLKKSLSIFCFLFFGLNQIQAQSLNIAFNKPTQQSTTANGRNSNLAVDNNTNGNFANESVTQTNNEENAWWQVDLENNIDISLIKIYNRTDAFTERLSNFHVFISSTNLKDRSYEAILADCDVEHIFVSDEPDSELNIPITTIGRYVRIQLMSANTLSLAEVEVYEKSTDQNCDDFCLVEDFDDKQNGSIRGQSNWVTNEPGALDGAIVSDDLNDGFTGKALMNDPNDVAFRGNAYKPLNQAIKNNEKGTLFFQILAEDLENTYSHFGLTDLASPRLTDSGTGEVTLYTDYEVQMSLDHGKFRVRNGTANSYLTNIAPENGIVYNIWMVVDNQTNMFEVYVQGGIYQFPIKAKTNNGITNFSFRNGTKAALQSLYLINSPDNVTNGIVYYDSFYIDDNKQNLTLPINLSSTFNFKTVENFEGLNEGSINGQNDWVSNTDNAVVAADSEVTTNQVLYIDAGSMEAHHPIPNIKNCSTGTVYYRIKRSGLVNQSIGLSDSENPKEFADFENQINMQNSSDDLNGRSGGSFLTLSNIANNQWYCVWMVTNNLNDTYNIYLQGNGNTEPIKLSSGSLTDFSYRNGTSSNPLISYFIKQNNSVSSFSIDDIYIDENHTNLSHPSSGLCNHNNSIIDTDSPLNDPISESITTNGVGIVLEEFVTIPASSSNAPATRINYLDHANDNSGRLFVNDLNNSLYLIENDIVSTYLNLKEQFINFAETPRLGSGFGFFTFHPEYATNGIFYTVHTERFDALTNITPDYTSFGTDDMHGIITEWKATNPTANIFSGTKREVLRIGFDTALHGFQQISFNPNAEVGDEDYGLLYLALGDGEENPIFSGAPQDLSVPHGKILRINPLENNAPNGNYGIPENNPFTNINNALDEIWAYGFRNPHRFSWDTEGTHKMFIGNIGEKNIDAIYPGFAGANYGWNEREGSFLFKKEDPNNVYALPKEDTFGYTYPVAEYDHDEGFAVVAGFVYRGDLIPELKGKYIFGDVVKGRVFYTEESEMITGESSVKINEFIIYDENGNQTSMLNLAGNSRADLRFGTDSHNEIYLLSKQNGKIWKLKGATGLSVNDYTIQNINLYPNPVEERLNIKLDENYSGIVKIAILNVLGKEIKKSSFNNYKSNLINIPVSDLTKGLYFIKLTLGFKSYTSKIIKK